MKKNIKKFASLAATTFALAAVVCSCSEDEVAVAGQSGIELSGTVYSSDSGEEIEGILILFSAFSTDDIDRTVPIRTDSCYSDSRGNYEINTIKLDTSIYGLMAADVDGNENGGTYNSVTADIDLSSDSPSYDPDSDTYVLSGLVFLMAED